jgi:hypothetical protein
MRSDGPPRRACKDLEQNKGKKRGHHDLLSNQYIIRPKSTHAVDRSGFQDLVAGHCRFAHSGAGRGTHGHHCRIKPPVAKKIQGIHTPEPPPDPGWRLCLWFACSCSVPDAGTATGLRRSQAWVNMLRRSHLGRSRRAARRHVRNGGGNRWAK